MISASSSGSFNNTMRFLQLMQTNRVFDVLDRYGREGVDALAQATPKETGETADSWYYEVSHKAGKHTVGWGNRHREDGVQIAIIIQYGHGTGTGGYVEGIDYINPALRPIFDRMANDIERQVRNG